MVMAGNEGVPGTLTEDSLATRLQWLRQRREKLQEKLAQKNNELKNLCVEEAELTGVLPPEIPLEPGETPPPFRRRVGTAFTYPQNLINRLKTNEAEESALELERQVQIGIVEAALGIVNDPAESKAVRRKHRLVYQQSQRRLQELDARLHFLRQSRGKSHRPVQFQHTVNYSTQPHLHTNVKHRTKKPRPPLENGGNDRRSPKSLIQEGGISLSPLGPEHKCNTYSGHAYDEQPICNPGSIYSTVNNAVEHRPNVKIIEHDHNDNHNVYILPDQYRARTYSHGSGGSRGQNHYPDERIYRPLPNTYNDEEHSVRYRQYQEQLHHQKQLQEHNHQYADYKHLDNDVQQQTPGSYEREHRASHCVYSPDYHTYKNPPQSQLLQRPRDRNVVCGGRTLRYESHLPPGYWMRYDDEIVWCTDEQHTPPPPPPPMADRFGSLDRRKRNALQYASGINADAQSRYRTVTVGSTKGVSNIAGHQHPSSVQLLPLTEQPPASNKLLLRTQSLGSVETWHSGHSHDSQSSKDTTDNVSRKSREKEWYETSLDSGTGPGLDLALMNAQHRNMYCQPSPPPSRSAVKPNEIIKDGYVGGGGPLNRKKEIHSVAEDQYQPQCLPLHQHSYEQHRPKVLEIPAESRPTCTDATEEAIRLGSPQNCTIVQAGKYQPYREVTKPFEMSDFYKYSTKFRKKGETAGHATTTEPQQDTKSADFSGSPESYKETQSSNYLVNSTVPSPVQKRIYQPVQRMTCQPYIANLR